MVTSDAHTETELTFEGRAVAGEVEAARLPMVARQEPVEAEVLDAVYFDTEFFDLLRRGVTLRRRAGGHDPGWHLKVPDGHGSRREYARPLADGRTHDSVPEVLERLACPFTRGRRLRPVAHLLTHRHRTLWVDDEGRELAELAGDHVAARLFEPGRLVSSVAAAVPAELITWEETEVELSGGDTSLLDAAARELSRQGLRASAGGVKLARALAEAGVEVGSPERVDVGARGRAAAGIVAGLREHADRLTALDPGVRLDEDDAVHQMRITARRLRSLLLAARRVVDQEQVADLAADLRWLGHELGTYREPEALQQRLEDQIKKLPRDCARGPVRDRLRSHFGEKRRSAHRALLDTLSSRRYFTLLDRLEDAVADPPLREGKHGSQRAERLLRREDHRTRRRLRKAVQLPEGPRRDHALHQARKAAKRARYTAETLVPVLGKAAERQERRHKTIHKRLGRHQDAVTCEHALTELARARGTVPVEAFAFGILRAGQRDTSERDISAAVRAAGL
jgi:CHAD domain-containing protein